MRDRQQPPHGEDASETHGVKGARSSQRRVGDARQTTAPTWEGPPCADHPDPIVLYNRCGYSCASPTRLCGGVSGFPMHGCMGLNVLRVSDPRCATDKGAGMRCVGDARLATTPTWEGEMRRRRIGCGSPCSNAWGKGRTGIPRRVGDARHTGRDVISICCITAYLKNR